MAHFTNYMRLWRVLQGYRGDYDKLQSQYEKQLDSQAKFKGSKGYDEIQRDLQAQKTQKKATLFRETIRKMDPIIADCEEAINGHFKKEPSQGMVNNITLLNMRQNITPSELDLYFDMYGDYPMAVQVLKEKAESLGYRVTAPFLTIDQMKWALEIVRDTFIGFIEGYDSLDNVESLAQKAMILRLEPYFQSEEGYINHTDVNSSEEAALQFWNDIVGFGDPSIFDKEGSVPKSQNTQVVYYFSDLNGLLKFIDAKTQNLGVNERDTVIQDILKDCPDRYSAAYRNYLATGEKIDIQA